MFGSLFLSVKEKSTKLGILQASLQTLFERTNKETNILVSFSVKLRIYIQSFYIIFHIFAKCKNITQSLCYQTQHNCQFCTGQFPDSFSQNFNIKGQTDKSNLTNKIFASISYLSSYVEVDIREK